MLIYENIAQSTGYRDITMPFYRR